MAQLVAHNLAKVGAAGSSPVSRFHIKKEWLQKGVALFYFEPRRGSKFEVSAAASVGASALAEGDKIVIIQYCGEQTSPKGGRAIESRQTPAIIVFVLVLNLSDFMLI